MRCGRAGGDLGIGQAERVRALSQKDSVGTKMEKSERQDHVERERGSVSRLVKTE